jgi:transposase
MYLLISVTWHLNIRCTTAEAETVNTLWENIPSLPNRKRVTAYTSTRLVTSSHDRLLSSVAVDFRLSRPTTMPSTAVSNDIKRAAVRMHLTYDLDIRTASAYLGIGKNTAYRAISQYERSGDVVPEVPRNKGGRPPILDTWDLSVSLSILSTSNFSWLWPKLIIVFGRVDGITMRLLSRWATGTDQIWVWKECISINCQLSPCKVGID